MKLAKNIRASLAYTGNTQEWLALQLNISEKTLRKRLKDDGEFKVKDLRKLKSIFKWLTLEG